MRLVCPWDKSLPSALPTKPNEYVIGYKQANIRHPHEVQR
jgi:hypothetical protein